MLVNLYKAGQMPNIIVDSNGGLGTYDGLAQKKYASMLDGPWSFSIFASAYKNTQLAGTTVPAGPGGSVSVVGGEDIVMTKSSKNKTAAAEFMRFMLALVRADADGAGRADAGAQVVDEAASSRSTRTTRPT